MPSAGMPMAELSTAATPMAGTPMAGMPMARMPAVGRAAAGTPAAGMARTGTAMAGTAMSGMSMVAGRPGRLARLRAGETTGAAVLVAAIVAALVWANAAPDSYQALWHWPLTVRIGPAVAALDLRGWVDSGLMTLFFLVVGLEARREIDLGELRDHRRLIVPLAAGLAGMALPALIYLAITAAGPGAAGWGAAMSTDTALALGVLTVVGRELPARIRTFVLTVFVVDDIVALAVIAIAYSGHVRPAALAVAAVAYLGVLACRYLGDRHRMPVFVLLGVTVWGALLASGVDPVVAGLAIGLATPAHLPRRSDLQQATRAVRLFREQPTPQLARTATMGLTATLSANDRLQHTFRTATGLLVVPLFALANAGVPIDAGSLRHALTAPVTIGIVAAYLLGKPVAVLGTSWLIARRSHGALRPPVGWAAVLGSGTIAGIGFTVSLLVAGLAFTGQQLADATLGILLAAAGASLSSLLVYRLTAALPEATRTRALLGGQQAPRDLDTPVDTGRDHVRGPVDAVVTVVEYGDFECPWTEMAAPTARQLLAEHTDIRYVWRHLPLPDVHPHAQLAAEAAEAAGEQGAFWAMHDALLAHQTRLEPGDLLGYAGDLGLDVDRFHRALRQRRFAARVERDVASADRSGVAGTPTFFINDRRHDGPQDPAALAAAIDAARRSATALPAAPAHARGRHELAAA
ncbi:Na+/H+ antiporter NhaA [Actinocatenispora comari]|nr:Na+/H+ antiporter NhaA [Actinocatenispora comari]